MKTDNHPAAVRAKVDLRRKVARELGEVRVFDAFCGRGEMARGAWAGAALYVGCDERDWTPADPVSRFVADNRRVLRAIDLAPFNCFDLDAYGSPWGQLIIIAARRPIAPGERMGFAVTDGSLGKLRWGGDATPHAVRDLLGETVDVLPSVVAGKLLLDRMEAAWAKRAGARIVKRWRAEGASAVRVRYSGWIVEGIRPAEAERAGSAPAPS